MMECDKCGSTIKQGEERDLYSQILCEDCYMDALSPAKGCDPWAVYLAKSSLEKSGEKAAFTDNQMKILNMLHDTKGLEVTVLSEKLKMKMSELEREIATLRHMEKVRGELKEGKVVIHLW